MRNKSPDLLIPMPEVAMTKNEIYLSSGQYLIKKNFVINENQSITVGAGVTLRFEEGAQLIVKGKLIANGTSLEPVIFESQDKNKYWRGIRVDGDVFNFIDRTYFNEESFSKDLTLPFSTLTNNNKPNLVLNNVYFQDVKAGKYEDPFINNYSAAIEINNSMVLIKNSHFTNILHGGVIQAFFSIVLLDQNKIMSNLIHKDIHVKKSVMFAQNNTLIHRQNTQQCNDGFWIIQSLVYLYKNTIIGKGDDGLDIKNSIAVIDNNYISNNKDEAIDLDIHSLALISNNKLVDNNNPVQITDSTATVINTNSISEISSKIIARNNSKIYIPDIANICNNMNIDKCITFMYKEADESEMKSLNGKFKRSDEKKYSLFFDLDAIPLESHKSSSYNLQQSFDLRNSSQINKQLEELRKFSDNLFAQFK